MTASRPDTWMPIYIGDYLADTMHLSPGEHGAYLLLIMAYWRNDGPLPDVADTLARIARCSTEEWQRYQSAIRAFFRVGSGVWRHKRIDEELATAKEGYQDRVERSRHANEEKQKRAKARREALAASSKETVKDTPEDTAEEPCRSPQGDPGGSQPQPQYPSDNVVVDVTRDPLAIAQQRVLEACGRSPNLELTQHRVKTWLEAGADLEADILPAIAGVLSVRRASLRDPDWLPNGLSYFDKAVTEAQRQRTKPMPEITDEQRFALPDFLNRNRKQAAPRFMSEIQQVLAKAQGQGGG